MDPPRKPNSREDRLAAKLRENLRRRKAQARALDSLEDDAADSPGADSRAADSPRPDSPALDSPGHPALSKTAPSR